MVTLTRKGNVRRAHDHSVPELAFNECRTLVVGYYSANQAIVTTVEACPGATFARLVRIAARRAKNPALCLQELTDPALDFNAIESKWWALLVLSRHQARPFLAASYVDCRRIAND